MIERTFIQQGTKKMKIHEYLKKELKRAGFVGADIIKTPVSTRVVINVTRPGLAIGKKGKTIKNLTQELEETFGFDNPQIEVQEVKKPELSAKACVDRIIALIERGYSWRSVVYRTMGDVIAGGAQGVEILLKGTLTGKGNRKRKARIAKGYMKKAGEQALLVDYAKGTAVPKQGAIGVKVRIIGPDTIFPDKIDIRQALAKEEKEEEKTQTVKETEEKEETEKEEKETDEGEGVKKETVKETKEKKETEKSKGKKEEKVKKETEKGKKEKTEEKKGKAEKKEKEKSDEKKQVKKSTGKKSVKSGKEKEGKETEKKEKAGKKTETVKETKEKKETEKSKGKEKEGKVKKEGSK